ncbi:carbohydrate kinase family protein [Aliiroseovarius sp. 2305UL8-7]|uniref:carbohydrate kinase family protein n=1 Tax=Aliiroseovarius conchicola TaxID=3121637 RepID=UPI0035294629
MNKIAVIGDPVIDQIYRTSDELMAGGKMLGQFVGSAAGGTTSNFACAAAKFGLRPSMIGQVANGWEGEFHKDAFQDGGVDVGQLRTHSVERGAHTIIAIGPDGEKTLIYVPFPKTGKEGVDADTLSEFDAIYLMAVDFARIAQCAEQLPSLICVDVDAAAGLDRDSFEQASRVADFMFINDVGYRMLFGSEPELGAIEDLLSGRLQCVVCTGGAGTSFAVARGQERSIESCQMSALKAEVVDTTGAGDCFNAAFLARRAAGKSLTDCLKFAMTAGALATETMGARASIPDKSLVMRRMKD